MDISRFKTVIDPLYGLYSIDSFLSHLIAQPEIQRLRDIRLSNIPSLLMPGSANISRFEHSLGTAYLAERIARLLTLKKRDHYHLVCAALLHDVAITPFGHLMEESFHYAGQSFDHESRLREIFEGSTELGNIHVQIYHGRTPGFPKVLNYKEYRDAGLNWNDVFAIERGQGVLGQLIKGTIDLDNIDNVCRMAYHLGIPFRRQLPTEVIEGFFIKGEDLCYDVALIHLIEEWLDVRERLYNILMTNPLDFVAKSMLIEAMRIAIVGTDAYAPILNPTHWKMTDSEVIRVLHEYAPTTALINYLQTGELFDLTGLYWIDRKDLEPSVFGYDGLFHLRTNIANTLRCKFEDIILYCISDKRTRPITNIKFQSRKNSQLAEEHLIGKKSSQILLGISTGKKELSLPAVEAVCRQILSEIAGAGNVTPCDPSYHLAYGMRTHLPSQLPLF